MRITGAPGKRSGEASRPQPVAKSAAAITVPRRLVTRATRLAAGSRRSEDRIGDAVHRRPEEVVVPVGEHDDREPLVRVSGQVGAEPDGLAIVPDLARPL